MRELLNGLAWLLAVGSVGYLALSGFCGGMLGMFRMDPLGMILAVLLMLVGVVVVWMVPRRPSAPPVDKDAPR